MTRHPVAIPKGFKENFLEYTSVIAGLNYERRNGTWVATIGIYLVAINGGFKHLASVDRKFPHQSDFSDEALRILNDQRLLQIVLAYAVH